MDLAPTDDDLQVRAVVERLLRERAGAARARACRAAGGGEDDGLLRALEQDLGWGDLLAGTTPAELVQQCIVAEACGRHVAQLPVAAVATGAKVGSGVVAVAPTAGTALRWPRSLTAVVVGSDARVRPVLHAEVAHVGWGDPWGRVVLGEPAGVAAREAGRWYRLLLLAEAVGAASAALDGTVAHVAERHQFGAPLASRQALRHRLAELSSELVAARLATFEAAAGGAAPRLLGLAATLVVGAVDRLVPEVQRFTGALGLSDEYDLHLLTGRARAAAAELGAPARVAAEAHRALREGRP